mmetsp:Transcript_36239/g.66576  ORF Transcript_36239/g.66576 Transcript_36239/m.66576 type:complete len:87 (+) Transcript_36239:1004-1264(+)
MVRLIYQATGSAIKSVQMSSLLYHMLRYLAFGPSMVQDGELMFGCSLKGWTLESDSQREKEWEKNRVTLNLHRGSNYGRRRIERRK